jgi:hypothetical protein
MTQVDHGLTNVNRFDSADSVISINDANYKPGASQLPRQDHDVEVVGKLCEQEQPSVFCSSTQSSMFNTPSQGPALLHVLH